MLAITKWNHNYTPREMDCCFSGNWTENDWIENIVRDLEPNGSPVGIEVRKILNTTAFRLIRQETGIHFSVTNNKYVYRCGLKTKMSTR